ncbi:MAG TPA: DUF4340 domain-containing protein [Candidatus Nitrosotenuis sp.]|nr:DUF4340 domain-containing protein [Candidatus Nitrosotenuis sp.]
MKKSTMIMVLLAAALGAGVWYFEFYRKPVEKPVATTTPAFAFSRDDIAMLSIVRAGETLTFERRGEGASSAWRLTRPVDSATDGAAMESLLSALTSASVSRTFPAAPEKLKEFGLDAPSVSLEVKLKSGAQHRVRFGANDFSNSNTYVLLDEGKEVSFIPSDLLTSADKPVLEFRDRRIAVFMEENLVRIRVRNQSGTLLAEKVEGKWLVREPAAKKDWELNTSRIFSTLDTARAKEIVDAPKPSLRARLAKPDVEVELTDKDGQTLRVAFAAAGKDEFYSTSSASNLIFKIESTTMDSLQFKFEDVLQEPEKPKEEKKEPAAPPAPKK